MKKTTHFIIKFKVSIIPPMVKYMSCAELGFLDILLFNKFMQLSLKPFYIEIQIGFASKG